MVCPTTGEGVGPAMTSGYIAAQFIERAVQADKFDKTMFLNYDREIYKRLQSDVKKYNMVRSLSPRLYNALINLLSNMSLSRYYFNKNISKWIGTAMTKPIEVEM
jgi:menaquinone-9 beta-reductase